MTASQSCLDLIKRFEGLYLQPYKDMAGNWTVGYGHKCSGPDRLITAEEADILLRRDVTVTEDLVSNVVRVPVIQPQFDALCSFTYNLGIGRLSQSTLLKLLNTRAPIQQVADEFLKWNKVNGQVMPGLTNRRAAERQLFLSQIKA